MHKTWLRRARNPSPVHESIHCHGRFEQPHPSGDLPGDVRPSGTAARIPRTDGDRPEELDIERYNRAAHPARAGIDRECGTAAQPGINRHDRGREHAMAPRCAAGIKQAGPSAATTMTHSTPTRTGIDRPQAAGQERIVAPPLPRKDRRGGPSASQLQAPPHGGIDRRAIAETTPTPHTTPRHTPGSTQG